MVLDSILVGVNNCERQLAIKHLEKCELKNICLIYDRGYPSYELCGELEKKEKKYVMRCSRSCFKEIMEVWSESGEIDKVIEIKKKKKKDKRKDKLIERFDLPESIKMRVIKLELKTGEDEVLITNIFDEEFKIEDFREIYRLRWGEEEFYKVIKERLSLENFSSLSVEGVRQDFESTSFITNIESIFSEEVDEELEKKCERKGNKNKQKVNKNISFNAIKNQVIEIFLSDTPIEELSERLEAIFRQSPTSIREGRRYARKRSASKSARYRKYSRKACF
jgi:Transposase DDE domain